MLSLFTSIGSFFSTIWAKLVIYAVIAAVIAALVWGVLHYQAAYVQAQAAVTQANAANAKLQQQAAAFNAAFNQYQANTEKRAAKTTIIRRTIYAAPSTKGCAGSPAIAAVLNGLRGNAAAGGKSSGAVGAADVPAPAAASVNGQH